MKKTVDTQVRYLKGIGPKRAKVLNQAGINSIEDLFYYFPRRYEDRTQFSQIKDLKAGQVQTIKAKVLTTNERQSFQRRAFSILELAVTDGTAKVSCVWFNQPYLKDYFKAGDELILYGKIGIYSGRLQMNSPEFEVISQMDQGQSPSGTVPDSLSIGGIVPIYPLPENMTQRYFRQIVKQALEEYLPQLNEFLPYDIRQADNLMNLAKAILNIHFPESPEVQKQAYQRLAFEEFFLFQLSLALRKAKKQQKAGIAHRIEGSLVKDFIASLPFKLTNAQEKVIAEIKQDLAKPQPMQRLLQGDVGSGKTIVATLAALFAIQGGYQVAFMVPTEILARQHLEKIEAQVTRQKAQVRVELLTGSASKKEKEKIYQELKEGKINLLIGTHALLEEKIEFKNLGLVVIDEQHKFGVGQRALLPEKGRNPDVLIMTATPIPRTLAITLYGDLDISVINELPPGRLPVKTIYFNDDHREQAYNLAGEQLRSNHQAYIIYPVIEESYALDIAGAKKRYAELKENEFKDFKLGLIHGRLEQSEQDRIMRNFKQKRLDALVATTVLEVGIDIASATCMIVEHAERFGLSQLHQLRGRIGRGRAESIYILVANPETPEARQRIQAMLKYSDGFRIAEEDLRIRGPGEFFGQRQHGLNELKIANPLTQLQLLKRSREAALKLINSDPHLETRQNLLLRAKLLQRFPDYEKLILVG